jgi:hypothetical protein
MGAEDRNEGEGVDAGEGWESWSAPLTVRGRRSDVGSEML